jgi:hypothetical protein
VRASRDAGGRIQWDCMAITPTRGARFLDTEIDRCRQNVLEIQTVNGRQSIPNLAPTMVEVSDPRITWWCDGSEEKATLPPGTRFVRVAWNRDDDGRIEWQSYTKGLQSACD